MSNDERTLATARRRCTVSMAVSLVVLVAAMAWTWKVGQRSNLLYHESYHAHEALSDLQTALNKGARR